jgi:hypothetical protein
LGRDVIKTDHTKVAKKMFENKSIRYKENWKDRMKYPEDIENDL